MRPLPLPPPPRPRSTDVALAAFLGLAVTAAILVGVVPKFAEVFLQVKVPMPGTTLLLVGVSECILADRWAAALLLVSIPASLSRLTPGQASIARVLVPVLVLAALAWMAAALFAPLGCGLTSIGRR